MFELFEHTADLGLLIQADSLESLFIDAAHGLLAMLVANPEAVRPLQTKTIALTADKPEYLLFDWLSELLYAFEHEKLLLCEFDIDLRQSHAEGEAPAQPHAPRESAIPQGPFATHLRAICRGEPMDQARPTMDHEVKAVTYHGLAVVQNPDHSWQAEVIVDI